MVFEERLDAAGDYQSAADYAEWQAKDDGYNKGDNEGDDAEDGEDGAEGDLIWVIRHVQLYI